MKKYEKIKIQIEKVNGEKENVQFEQVAYLNTHIIIAIFLATSSIAVLPNVKEISQKIIIFLGFIGLILICYFSFNSKIKKQEVLRKEKIGELSGLYKELLK